MTDNKEKQLNDEKLEEVSGGTDSDSDEMMERYMEEITYSSLVQWLLNETI